MSASEMDAPGEGQIRVVTSTLTQPSPMGLYETHGLRRGLMLYRSLRELIQPRSGGTWQPRA